jgi:hypothetical protein
MCIAHFEKAVILSVSEESTKENAEYTMTCRGSPVWLPEALIFSNQHLLRVYLCV